MDLEKSSILRLREGAEISKYYLMEKMIGRC